MAVLFVVACGGGTEPRLIPGGGIGDGDIDGNVFVHVIDAATDKPVVGASVVIGGQTQFTDVSGFVELGGVEGPQTIAVRAESYRDTVWARVNGTNVTIPIASRLAENPSQRATVSGTVTGWDPTVQVGHTKRAIIFYSGTDDGFEAIPTASNSCMSPPEMPCYWALGLPRGPAVLLAALIDEVNGAQTVTGWASKTVLIETDSVGAPINQTDVALAPIDAAEVTVDFGSPPSAFTSRSAMIGIELAEDMIIQLPMVERDSTMLVPKPSLLGANAKLRLTAWASGSSGATAVLRRGLTGPTLAAGAWLAPPASATATRMRAAWQPVAGATFYTVSYDQVDITVFDADATSVDVPPLVAPTAGTSVRVGAIGADIDPQDFSLRGADLFANAVTLVPL